MTSFRSELSPFFRAAGAALAAAAALAALPASAWEWGGGPSVVGSGNFKTETRAVSGFSGISLSIPAKVTIVQGNAETLSIEGEDNILPLVETVVDGGTLKIRWKERMSSIRTKQLKIALGVKAIDHLAISGAGDIRSEQINAPRLSTSISGSGDIVIASLTGDSLKVSISGSGDFTAGGRVGSVEASIAGSGDLKTAKLDAKTVKVSIAGSGDAAVWAREQLRVSVAGSGDVVYYGDPEISKSVAGSGSLKRLGAAPAI